MARYLLGRIFFLAIALWVIATLAFLAIHLVPGNVTAFLLNLVKDKKLNLNLQDEITRDTLLTQGGEVVNARVREFFALPALAAKG